MDWTGHVCVVTEAGAGIARVFTEKGYPAAFEKVLYVTGADHLANDCMNSLLNHRERYTSQTLEGQNKS
jgi:hypothetical protein